MIDSVKIGGLVYDVQTIDDLHDNHKPLWGWIRFDKTQILLSSDLNPQAAYQTLWHEIIHGIFEHAAIEQDEQIVEAVAHGIVAILRDNPGIAVTVDGSEKR